MKFLLFALISLAVFTTTKATTNPAATEAAGTTTEAAGTTTEAAGTTTEAAGTTTEAAGTTTAAAEAAGTTTAAAGTTTAAAGTTTAAAEAPTTKAAATTTKAAAPTTNAVVTTTKAAETTTKAAATTTKAAAIKASVDGCRNLCAKKDGDASMYTLKTSPSCPGGICTVASCCDCNLEYCCGQNRLPGCHAEQNHMCKDECRDAWVKNPQGNCVGAELCSTVEYADNICAVKNKKNGTSCTSDKNQNDKRAICGERKDKPGMYCLSPVLDAIQYCDALYIVDKTGKRRAFCIDKYVSKGVFSGVNIMILCGLSVFALLV